MHTRTITQSFTRVALVTVGLLLIPFVLMFITSEMNWGPEDFIVMGALIFVLGFTYELIARKVFDSTKRTVIAIVIAFVFLLIWVDLAVGIFNIPGFSGS